MKTTALSLLLIGALLAAIPHGAKASPLLLPATLYPAGAVIHFNPSLSNHAMDCTWGFFCEGGVPLFHSLTQSELHRVRGWDQLASVPRPHETRIVFWLFASRYGFNDDLHSGSWAATAFADLMARTRAHGFTPLSGGFHLLPSGADGAAAAVVEHSGSRDLAIMATWTGTTEVEAVVMYEQHSPTAAAAILSLARQVRRATLLGA